jgi:alanine racemase
VYSLADLQQICGGDLIQTGNPFPLSQISHFVFDSRMISAPGATLFIALHTPNRDGHQYIQDAYRKGVRHFWVSYIPKDASGNFLITESPLKCLQRLAAWHRKQFQYPVIGITGSNGKTIVKEWIATLIDTDFEICRSPGSFNSSLGVPLSILKMNADHSLALIEAGISKVGEMQVLEEMIQPDTLVLTHMGAAHAEGFYSFEEKIQEKLQLGNRALMTLTWSAQRKFAEAQGLPVKSIGPEPWNDCVLENLQEKPQGWSFRINKTIYNLNQEGQASLENACLALLTALEYGIPEHLLQERISGLHPIAMRMEMITDNPATTVLNDAFTADPDSVRNAFQALNRITAQPRKIVILTDLDHQGKETVRWQEQLMTEAVNQFGKENVLLIGPIFQQLAQSRHLASWPSPQAMLEDLSPAFFEKAAVLLKGARRFSLEQLVPVLSGKVSATYFRIDLNAVLSNYRILKSKTLSQQKIMAMVKASAYGSGSWEIAKELESEGVDYLAVAYISEGITLREKGIRIPVMVMNPDPEGLLHLNTYQLEPVVYSIPFLDQLIRKTGNSVKLKIHIEVESGMMRLGFPPKEAEHLCQWLLKHPNVEVASVFTHLAAADLAEEDDFTREQFAILRHFAGEIRTVRPHFLLHAQNTAGTLRFPEEKDLNMVRFGIGLYGLSPGKEPISGLRETGSLITSISQLHECKAGSTIGYNRSLKTKRDSIIATLPLGYADGIPRRLSNGKVHFGIRGKLAPVAGNICMDMIMLDVTDIPGVKTGDEVLIFGHLNSMEISVEAMAQAAETIPYEIITGIHPRVRRLYVKEY